MPLSNLVVLASAFASLGMHAAVSRRWFRVDGRVPPMMKVVGMSFLLGVALTARGTFA